MASTLSNTGISDAATIKPEHVSQSVDAFTGVKEYDIKISGSTTLTGSFNLTGSLTHTGSSNHTGNYNISGNISTLALTCSAITASGAEIFASNLTVDSIGSTSTLTLSSTTEAIRSLSGSQALMTLSYHTASFEQLKIVGEISSSGDTITSGNPVTVNNLLKLTPRVNTPHPALCQTGSLMISGSNDDLALYIFTGGSSWKKVDFA